MGRAVGDGAPWIADQVKEQFGAQGNYLLDFYQVCDYLAAAKSMVADRQGSKPGWTSRKSGLRLSVATN